MDSRMGEKQENSNKNTQFSHLYKAVWWSTGSHMPEESSGGFSLVRCVAKCRITNCDGAFT